MKKSRRKKMKKIYKLILGGGFFVLALYTLTFIEPTKMIGYTTLSQLAIKNIIVTMIFIFLLTLSITCLTTYFFKEDKTSIIGIIPARMSSTRFPNKPLAKINGVPMVGIVYNNSKQCNSLNEVYITTPDKEISNYANQINAKCILTSDKHERASERVAETLKYIEQSTNEQADIIVMIQGDEPMVTPEMIDASIQPLLKGEAEVTNLMYQIDTEEEKNSINTIKVVTDLEGNALYFSRSVIPNSSNRIQEYYKQVCVIAFTRNALKQFESLTPTSLEKAESIDMFRFLEHGVKVKMVKTNTSTHSVDTQEDLKLVEKLMKK